MKQFHFRAQADGGMDFGERNRAIFVQYLKDNPGMLFTVEPVLPESNKQRRFFEGAVVPLVTFYQEGYDHKNSAHNRAVREWLKTEFNGAMIEVAGKSRVVAKSSKGSEALNTLLERTVEWLHENYAPPHETLDPESYNRWRDTVYSFKEGPDTYIDYLVAMNILKPVVH